MAREVIRRGETMDAWLSGKDQEHGGGLQAVKSYIETLSSGAAMDVITESRTLHITQ